MRYARVMRSIVIFTWPYTNYVGKDLGLVQLHYLVLLIRDLVDCPNRTNSIRRIFRVLGSSALSPDP